MKYDIHKFEHLHFLIEQIEKANATWVFGSDHFLKTPDRGHAKYQAVISIISDAQDDDYPGESETCPVEALANAYKQFKDAQENKDGQTNS